ncbi:MAG: hypothetical protein ABIL52_01785 [candidate division WOR-3 bacterium]
MKERKVKSNRAQADYFELLVCRYICQKYNISFAYSGDLDELYKKILRLPNGKERLELQNNNLSKLVPKLDEILDFEVSMKGKIIEVMWVGRKLVIKTTSDINVKHPKQKYTKFSVKSIFKSGLGTIKNLGMRSLKKYLNVEFNKEYNEMWQKLKAYLKRSSLSKSEIKKLVLNNQKLLNWATKNGQVYQRKLNNLCYEAFNKLSNLKKVEFLNFILDAYDPDLNLCYEAFNKLSNLKKVEFLNFILDAYDPDLYVIIVNMKGVVIYKPIQRKLSYQQKIEAKDNTGVGYTIYIDGVPVYRVQTNATNGIGISPFCQRVFWALKL